MDEIEIQQHYDEFFEEIYVELEKVTKIFRFRILRKNILSLEL